MSMRGGQSEEATEQWLTVPTGGRDYISGRCALNLEDPASGDVADWHQGGWSAGVERHGECRATTGSELSTETINTVWGNRGLFDARPALREMPRGFGRASSDDCRSPGARHGRTREGAARS